MFGLLVEECICKVDKYSKLKKKWQEKRRKTYAKYVCRPDMLEGLEFGVITEGSQRHRLYCLYYLFDVQCVLLIYINQLIF